MKKNRYDNSRKFDDISSKKLKEASFGTNSNLITKYDPEFCNKIIEHCREGNFIEAFCGRYNICPDTMASWLDRNNKEYKEFRTAAKIGQSATMFYYNNLFLQAIKDPESYGDIIGVIKSILSELMKSVPDSIRQLQFENISQQETSDERKKRLELEQKKDIYNAFNGGNNG